jgi:hypothetical protein
MRPGDAGGRKNPAKVAETFRQATDALVKPRADLKALEENVDADSLELAACREILAGCKETLKLYGSRLEDRYRALDEAKEITDGYEAREVRRHAEKACMGREYELVLESRKGETGQPCGIHSTTSHLTPKATASHATGLAPWSTTPVLERYAAGENFTTSGLSLGLELDIPPRPNERRRGAFDTGIRRS